MTDMSTTAIDASARQESTPGVGRLARVTGPTVDIEFPPDAIPAMYNALVATVDPSAQGGGENVGEMTFEGAQHLGDNAVRAVALTPTAGLLPRLDVRA